MDYLPHSTDEELKQGCIRKDRLAQQYLYRRYFGKLLAVAMRYTDDRDTGVEVLNTAFLKIFNNLENFQETGAFQAWMASIVVHTAIDQYRSRSIYRQRVEPLTEAHDSIAQNNLSCLEVEDLFRLLQQLPPATRTVFNLYAIEGYKHREIADLLDIDEGTSKWHLSAARKQLQHLVKKYHQTSPYHEP